MKGFAETLQALRQRSGKSMYRLAQDSGIDQSYILRLERGEKDNPSCNTVLMIGFALVRNCDSVDIHDVEELLLAADYAPLRRRSRPRDLVT